MNLKVKLLVVGIASAAALLIAVAPASAANRFADPTGSGPEPCLVGNPCSLANAVNNSTSGDDVTVATGTYTPGPVSLVIPANVTVHGTPGARPDITANPGGAPGVSLSAGSILRDFIYTYNGINNPAIRLNGGGTLERVTSIVTPLGGSTSGACRTDGSGTFTIRESACINNPVSSNPAGGIHAFAATGETQNISLTNVTAVSTTADPGIRAWKQDTGVINMTATNTIADGTTTDVMATQLSAGAGSVTINLTNSNYANVNEVPGFGLNVTDAGTGPPNNNQTTPPVYASPGSPNYDYRQTRSSLGTIDLGSATASTLDFQGTGRPQGAGYDIGADEIVRSDPPVIDVAPLAVEGDNQVSGTTTEPDGTFIEVFRNGTSIGNGTATGGLWTASVSVLPSSGTLTATAAAPNEATSLPSAGKTITPRSAKPVVNAPIPFGATTVSGTSTEAPGTMVQVIVNGAPAGAPVAVQAGGIWSATVPALTGGQLVSARQTAVGEFVSLDADPVTVQDRSAKPVVNSPLVTGSTSVTGTSTEAAATTVQVYVDDVPAGAPVAVAPGGTWSATVPALALGQVVTARQTAMGETESLPSDPVTVTAPPASGGGGTTTQPITTQPVTPAPKKCKKGQKLKKGKCVKKKKRKKK